MTKTLVEFRNVSKFFGSVIALEDISFKLEAGGCVCCLLGDNGAGKSTLIKILSGVHKPSEGEIYFEGKKIEFESPRDAMDMGIGVVYQDLALIPLMSVTRNFFMGREPTKRFGVLDMEAANKIAKEKMAEIGINVRDPSQAVGTMSGGERQCLAIARAIYFGAKVLILDEPTAALGVKQSAQVLRFVAQARERGIGVIFITHNVHHAFPIANDFTLLNRGHSLGFFHKNEVSREQILEMMAGGQELQELEQDLKDIAGSGKRAAKS
ncbi:MAG: ATP-binding cassette domain-containing protein [Gammaproteobacteria bacterium]|nr:ATP-binding cassette domain-containing protein [Gammaproteobacteria bacterium]